MTVPHRIRAMAMISQLRHSGYAERAIGGPHPATRAPNVRKMCGHGGCPNRHLRGSDFCFDHDDGKRPKTRHSD